MAISFAIPTSHEFSLAYGAADIVAIAPSILSLTSRGIYPESLHDLARKKYEALIPEADGARDLSDGKVGPATIAFLGQMYATDQEDLFSDLAAKLNNLAVSPQISYIKGGFYDGSAKQYMRRYGKFLSAVANYAPKTNYECIAAFEMYFRALDPWWYFDTARTATGTFSASTGGTIALADTGIARSKRTIVTITRTGTAAATSYQIKNAANQAFTMAGTLAATSDKWVIDMMNGTVTKYTSGGTVAADDMASWSGQFWGVKNGTDTITVLAGPASTFTVKIDWLERRM
jgi:hypothetical protein